MQLALLKLRISLNDVLGQEWRLHRIVTAVENNGRARDRKRIQLATDYLISQGHGQNMSVSGVLRLCHDLKVSCSMIPLLQFTFHNFSVLQVMVPI